MRRIDFLPFGRVVAHATGCDDYHPADQGERRTVTEFHVCHLAEGLPGVMRHGECPLLFPLAQAAFRAQGKVSSFRGGERDRGAGMRK